MSILLILLSMQNCAASTSSFVVCDHVLLLLECWSVCLDRQAVVRVVYFRQSLTTPLCSSPHSSTCLLPSQYSCSVFYRLQLVLFIVNLPSVMLVMLIHSLSYYWYFPSFLLRFCKANALSSSFCCSTLVYVSAVSVCMFFRT